jgi:hypothetical protein
MPTNLALDDRLIEEAVRVGGHKSKKDAVTAALKEYILHRRQLGIIGLFNSFDFDPAYNHKADRQRDRIEHE